MDTQSAFGETTTAPAFGETAAAAPVTPPISKPLTVDALRPLLALGWGDRELPELAPETAQAPAAAADVAPTGSPPQAVMGAA